MRHDWVQSATSVPGEWSPALNELGVKSGFAIRQPGVEVAVERQEALERLESSHVRFQTELGMGAQVLRLAEQVHGVEIGVANGEGPERFAGADALVTQDAAVCLGIYVADCCAVYLVDPERKAIGLAHSGAKGTRLGIVPKVISEMQQRFGTRAENLHVVLSPCIRPPHYEVDFAAEIQRQCVAAGVQNFSDPRICTGEGMARYYSYRREQGKTGRMLALLSLRS